MEDIFGYKDKICIITGASSGMGLETTKLLVNLGAKVYAIDLNPCNVDGIEKYIRCDLSNKDDIDKAFEEIPQNIDSFFGNAGLSGSKTDYLTTFNCNYTANMYITEKYLSDRMSEGASILYVSSAAGLNWEKFIKEERKVVFAKSWDDVQKKLANSAPSTFAYMYSKRCLSYYSSVKAAEFGKKHIRVNNVLPGSTDTGMKDEFEKMAGGHDALVSNAGMAGRLATSKEMANCIIFINSKMASFVSGLDFVVDYADLAMKKIGVKRDISAVSATNPLIISIAKKMMEKQKSLPSSKEK